MCLNEVIFNSCIVWAMVNGYFEINRIQGISDGDFGQVADGKRAPTDQNLSLVLRSTQHVYKKDLVLRSVLSDWRPWKVGSNDKVHVSHNTIYCFIQRTWRKERGIIADTAPTLMVAAGGPQPLALLLEINQGRWASLKTAWSNEAAPPTPRQTVVVVVVVGVIALGGMGEIGGRT